MTLTQLRYLIAIADAGLNITQAAERVHATQPGISKQLKALEDELGFLLFQRKGRSLEAITEAGAVVLVHARRAVAEAANIRAFAANQRGELAGTLHMATTHTQARFVLPAAIAALNREYPQVGVQLQSLADNDVLPHLAKGSADFAIVSTVGSVPAGGHAIPLYRWRRVVVVPKGHPLAGLGRAPTLAELAAHPLVSYHSTNQPESSLRRAFTEAGLQPTVAMTAPAHAPTISSGSISPLPVPRTQTHPTTSPPRAEHRPARPDRVPPSSHPQQGRHRSPPRT